MGVPFHIETQDTYSVVKEHIPEGKTMCSLCSRLRRGILYRVADELGATKIALGHHRDDMLRTFFPEHVLRRQAQGHAAQGAERPGRPPHHPPLAYVAESDSPAGPRSATSPSSLHPVRQPGNLQRKQIGQMLRDWQQLYPGRIENMAVALRNLVPSHFMDTRQFDFKGLVPNGVAGCRWRQGV